MVKKRHWCERVSIDDYATCIKVRYRTQQIPNGGAETYVRYNMSAVGRRHSLVSTRETSTRSRGARKQSKLHDRWSIINDEYRMVEITNKYTKNKSTAAAIQKGIKVGNNFFFLICLFVFFFCVGLLKK